MSDLHQPTIREALERIACIDGDCPCPIAAADAYAHIDSPRETQELVLYRIASNIDEPWAAQVANDWLTANGL